MIFPITLTAVIVQCSQYFLCQSSRRQLHDSNNYIQQAPILVIMAAVLELIRRKMTTGTPLFPVGKGLGYRTSRDPKGEGGSNLVKKPPSTLTYTPRGKNPKPPLPHPKTPRNCGCLFSVILKHKTALLRVQTCSLSVSRGPRDINETRVFRVDDYDASCTLKNKKNRSNGRTILLYTEKTS